MNLKDDISKKNAQLLHEGITNESFLIDNKYVYRNKKVNLDPFNQSKNEAQIIKELAKFDFVENVLDYDEKSGKKLSLYIPDTTRLDINPSKKQLEMVAQMIERFHHLDIKMDYDFSPFERLAFYKKDVDSEIDKAIEKKVLTEANKLYRKYPLVPSHNDLVKGNLLFKEGKLYLLDFEYAGKNIALFDIASFLSENKITKDSEEYFVSLFSSANKKDVITMINFENILWYYWAKYLFEISKRHIFAEIANEKLAAINSI